MTCRTTVNLEDNLYDVVVRGNIQERDLSIAFIDDNNIGGYMDFSYAGEFPSPTYVKPEFPKVLKDLGVPEYEREEYTFGDNCVLDKAPYKLEIRNTNGNEEANYRTKLIKNGFEVTELFGYKEYKKQVNTKIIAISINNAQIDNGYLTITIGVEDAPTALEVTSISLVGSFNDWNVTTNCIEFTKINEGVWRLNEQHLEAGSKFKIVINHTWEIHGGYGYIDMHGIDAYSKLLTSEDAEGNILVNTACAITLAAEVNGENVFFRIESAVQL